MTTFAEAHHPLDALIARIWNGKQDKVIGAGLLVDNQHVLTCAHVVRGALNLPNTPDIPPDAPIYLDFPLRAEPKIVPTRVTIWEPVKDIAGLRIDEQGLLQKQVVPVEFTVSSNHDYWNHRFRAFGFPENYPKGVWASGVIRGLTGDHHVQIEDDDTTGYRVLPGFSGTPVWDDMLSTVVGIVVVTDKSITNRAAFFIPTNIIIQAWPNLKSYSKLARLDNVPHLPRSFETPQVELEQIKNTLLENVNNPDPFPWAVNIVGMGGVGKTVLATIVAHNPDIRRTFSDGIYWIRIGQEANLTIRQAQLVEALGESDSQFSDIQQGKAKLQRLLVGKKCLIILDDVWHSSQFDAFYVSTEAKLGFVVTTRHAYLLNSVNALNVYLNVPQSSVALTILAHAANVSSETIAQTKEALEIVKACGNLPLAVAMVGSTLRHHSGPNPWVHTLKTIKAKGLKRIRFKFPDYPHPNLVRAFEVSLLALDQDESLNELNPVERYTDLAIFPKNIPIPTIVLASFWQTKDLDEIDTEELLETFVERSLATRNSETHILLHDLQIDYIRYRAGDITLRHEQLLLAYSKQCQVARSAIQRCAWYTGPNDGYFFENLHYHLAETKNEAELFALLLDQNWLSAQRSIDASLPYCSEAVESLILLSKSHGKHGLPRAIALHYIQAIIGERANNVSNGLLELLVHLGQSEMALRYAKLSNNPERKANSLCVIGLAFIEIGESLRAIALLSEAREIALKIQSKKSRGAVLLKISDGLAKLDSFHEAIESALQALAASVTHGKVAIRLVAELLLQQNKVEETLTLLKQGIQKVSDYSQKIWLLEEWVSLCNVPGVFSYISDEAKYLMPDVSIELAKRMIEVGQEKAGREILDNAIIGITAMEYLYRQDYAWFMATETFILLSEFRRAHKCALSIQDDAESRALVLGHLAVALAQAGRHEEAHQLVSNLDTHIKNDTKSRQTMNLWHSIVKVYTLTDRLNQILLKIQHSEHKDEYSNTIIEALLENNNLEQAYKIAANIVSDYIRDNAYHSILKHLVDRNLLNDALAFAIEAKPKQKDVLIKALANEGMFHQALEFIYADEADHSRDFLMTELALIAVKAGQKYFAENLLNELIKKSPPVYWSTHSHNQLKLEIAKAYALAGDFEKPLKLAETLVEEEPSDSVAIYIALATLLIEQHKIYEAQVLVQNARDICPRVEPFRQVELLTEIVLLLFALDQAIEAEEMISQIDQRAPAGPYDTGHEYELAVNHQHLLAKLYLKLSRFEESREVVERSDFARHQVQIRLSIACYWFEQGYTEKLLDEVSEIVHDFVEHARDDDWLVSTTLDDVFLLLAETNQWNEIENLSARFYPPQKLKDDLWWIRIGMHIIKAGHTTRTEDILSKINSARAKVPVYLSHTAMAVRKEMPRNQATIYLHQALMYQDSYSWSEYAEAALVYHSLGELPQAKTMLLNAYEDAKKLNTSGLLSQGQERSEALEYVAKIAIETGYYDEALQIVTKFDENQYETTLNTLTYLAKTILNDERMTQERITDFLYEAFSQAATEGVEKLFIYLEAFAVFLGKLQAIHTLVEDIRSVEASWV